MDNHLPWALKINDYEHYVAIIEIVGLSLFYVSGTATYDHYTWWSLALVWLYIVIIAVTAWSKMHVRTVRRELWLAPFLSAFIVVLGVIIMSSLPCSLLKELYFENGPLIYTSGNFLAHYYPLLRMVAFAPIRFKAEKPLIFVLHLILIYTLSFNPNTIYGCTALSQGLTTLLLCGIPFLLAAVCVTL